MKNLFHYSLVILLFLFTNKVNATNSCRMLLDETRTTDQVIRSSYKAEPSVKINPELLLADEGFIAKYIKDVESSYSFWGQLRLKISSYRRAVLALSNSELVPELIQKTHRELTDGKSRLKFRDTSDAHVIGNYSFRGNVLLNPEQVAAVESNPFLWFRPSTEAKPTGLIAPEAHVIGDIMFPSILNYKKFEILLKESTVEKIKAMRDPSKKQEAKLNALILNDLLDWTLQEAKNKMADHSDPVEIVLAELEWRVKALGLYFEPIDRVTRNGIESTFSGLNMNRSNELAEVIVDSFVIRHGLAPDLTNGLLRAYRPSLTDKFDVWTTYMRNSLTGKSHLQAKKLERECSLAAEEISTSQSSEFKDFYLTRLMTGVDLEKETAQSLLRDFQKYRHQYNNRNISEKERLPLIPVEFISNFGSHPESFSSYWNKYYQPEGTLFRGVSNPSSLSDHQLAEYFYSFKGRLASEMARSDFDRRIELAKLSMLKYNDDLINGRIVETASQHAAKHMGYEKPNAAKTYYVSTTDLNTVAFRFAMDKGYVTSSSTARNGNTFFVIESMIPKAGAVDFSSFKAVEPTWKNRYPRQFETTIVGGIDPNSIVRIYILEPYKEGERIPKSGPEKHGRILRILERDKYHPAVIKILERNSDNIWVSVGVIDF